MKRFRLAARLLALGAATSFSGSAEANQPIDFKWFEYSGSSPTMEATIATGEYQNPILTGFYPDPSVCQVGEDYYLINSTFAYFPGIPIFHSRDLINWTQIGHVIHRPEQLPYEGLGVSRGIFAPAITHHDGTFYVLCTMVDAGGNFVVTARDPAGPWSDPTWLDFEGIDPSLFIDDDGRGWIVNNGAPEGTPLYDGHRAIWIQEFDVAAKKMIGPRHVLVNGGIDISTKPIWIEGPHLYKLNGWYYLSCAEGGTGPGHSQVVLRSRRVEGPYTSWQGNPILTQRDLDPVAPGAVTCTGHADFVEGPDGRWWAIFLGVRPYDGRFSPMGRETFLLPVTWTDDGWPMILPADQRVPLTGLSPGGAALQASTAPLTGNFNWRDDFTHSQLSPLWIMLRTPKEPWWTLKAADGRLALTPRAERLSGTGNPSFLARRVQHPRFSAATSLAVPTAPGVSAGLVVFQNEKYHYFLAARRDENGPLVYLERHQGDVVETAGSARLPTPRELTLRVTADHAKCSFEYSVDGTTWRTLARDLDARMLTTDVAGGFVGATVGMHARIDR